MTGLSFEFRHNVVLHLLDFRNIDLVENNNLWFLGQERVVFLQFFVDGNKISDRIVSTSIHNVQENLTPLDVSQKCGSKSGTSRSTLDQSRNVAQHQSRSLVADVADPEVRNDRRKGIVGDLGPGRRCRRQQGGLPGVGLPQKPDVGDEPQLDREPPLGSRFGPLGQLRCGVAVRLEGGVAPAPAPTPRYQHRLSVFFQLARQFLGVQLADDRSGGDGHDDVFPLLAVLSLSEAVPGFSRSDVDAVPQRGQGIDTLVAHQVDGSAPPAVSTVGPAHRLALFAPEGNAAVSSVSAGDVNASSVEKLPFLVVLHGVLLVRILAVVVNAAALGQEFFFGQDGFLPVAIEDIGQRRKQRARSPIRSRYHCCRCRCYCFCRRIGR
mmetsp:Transcript_15697/g.32552  ORF Transcript_15697/g.32552 Transcript_15697/m.32552 type:complete len:380 (-) Transcript_15697:150-1289(-)